MNSVPPLDSPAFYGKKIEDANVRKVVASGKAVCEADSRCRFVNIYDVLTTNGVPVPVPVLGVLLPDKIHLAPKGYQLWIKATQSVF